MKERQKRMNNARERGRERGKEEGKKRGGKEERDGGMKEGRNE